MPRLVRVAVLLTILCCIGCVRDLNLREGILSFRMQNYRDAFVRLMPEALKGQPDAQYAVGYMYYYGQGVVENHRKAMHWIHLAAKHGQSEALVAMKILDTERFKEPMR